MTTSDLNKREAEILAMFRELDPFHQGAARFELRRLCEDQLLTEARSARSEAAAKATAKQPRRRTGKGAAALPCRSDATGVPAGRLTGPAARFRDEKGAGRATVRPLVLERVNHQVDLGTVRGVFRLHLLKKVQHLFLRSLGDLILRFEHLSRPRLSGLHQACNQSRDLREQVVLLHDLLDEQPLKSTSLLVCHRLPSLSPTAFPLADTALSRTAASEPWRSDRTPI